jgi:hypothetical protein
MRAEELAEILHAGWEAIPGKSEPAASALAVALAAMEDKAREVAARPVKVGTEWL